MHRYRHILSSAVVRRTCKKTKTMSAVYVPIVVDAYLNHDPSIQPSQSPDRAYLAPLTTPNFESLQLDNGLIEHDIFEDLRNAPYLASRARTRALKSRQGIYIHWSLPKPYRSGIHASSTGGEAASTAAHAAGHVDASVDSGSTAFHQAPTRWLIVRRLQSSGPSIPVSRPDANSPNTRYQSSTKGSKIMPGNIVFDYFMVESVRIFSGRCRL